MKVILILVVTVNVVLVTGQFKNPIPHRFGFARATNAPFTGQYRPTPRYRITNFENGEDGQYRPEIYNRNDADGRYVPDDSGKYVHIDVPYDGGYGDKGNRGGYYDGDYQRYQHQNDPNGPNFGFQNRPTPPARKIFTPPVTIPKPPINFNRNINSNPTRNYASQLSAASRYRTYGNEGGWRILRLDKDIDPISYNYAYETENKIIGEEAGRLTNPGAKDESIKTSGFYEYEGDDGKKYRVEYIADENGFVPKGAHIPEGIEQVAEYLAKTSKN